MSEKTIAVQAGAPTRTLYRDFARLGMRFLRNRGQLHLRLTLSYQGVEGLLARAGWTSPMKPNGVGPNNAVYPALMAQGFSYLMADTQLNVSKGLGRDRRPETTVTGEGCRWVQAFRLSEFRPGSSRQRLWRPFSPWRALRRAQRNRIRSRPLSRWMPRPQPRFRTVC